MCSLVPSSEGLILDVRARVRVDVRVCVRTCLFDVRVILCVEACTSVRSVQEYVGVQMRNYVGA